MQNSVCKKFALATAFLLALSGVAVAGDNAGVAIGISGANEISDVGSGGSVSVADPAALLSSEAEIAAETSGRNFISELRDSIISSIASRLLRVSNDRIIPAVAVSFSGASV